MISQRNEAGLLGKGRSVWGDGQEANDNGLPSALERLQACATFLVSTCWQCYVAFKTNGVQLVVLQGARDTARS